MKSQIETYIDSYEIPLSPHDMFPGVFHVDRVNPHSRAPTVPSTSRSLDLWDVLILPGEGRGRKPSGEWWHEPMHTQGDLVYIYAYTDDTWLIMYEISKHIYIYIYLYVHVMKTE